MFQALELSPGPATVEVRPAGIPAPFLLTTAVLAGPNLGEPEPHMHPEGMIMWPSRGSVVVLVEGAMRTLAVGQGIWVPPFTPHTMEVDASSTGCCTYFTPEVAPDWHSVGTVQLGAAFRELLLHLAESPMEVDQRLRAQTVVIELLPEATSYVETVPVPVPRDERLAPLVRRVLNDPADDRGVEAWAWHLSLSVRTIARIFAAEVGMTFSHWRTMVRMAAAARMLADDLPVGTVAGRVGYAPTPSAAPWARSQATGGRSSSRTGPRPPALVERSEAFVEPSSRRAVERSSGRSGERSVGRSVEPRPPVRPFVSGWLPHFGMACNPSRGAEPIRSRIVAAVAAVAGDALVARGLWAGRRVLGRASGVRSPTRGAPGPEGNASARTFRT